MPAKNLLKRFLALMCISLAAFVLGIVAVKHALPPVTELLLWVCVSAVSFSTGLWVRRRRETTKPE